MGVCSRSSSDEWARSSQLSLTDDFMRWPVGIAYPEVSTPAGAAWQHLREPINVAFLRWFDSAEVSSRA